jgi:sugar lactone lactonase YvrE
MKTQVECIVRANNILGEVPLWGAQTQKLWWIDIYAPALHSYDPRNNAHASVPLPGKIVGSFAMRQSGGMVIARNDGFFSFDPATGASSLIACPEPDKPEHRLNDGKCDRRGRYWVGSMHATIREPRGTFYRIDPDHSVHPMFDGFILPNSVAISPDDSTFYFADTLSFTIWAFDFDLDAGVLSNRRVFADTKSHPGRPDGSTVDTEGFLWNAEMAGGRIVRYAPDGRIDRTIPLPVSRPTSCGFGGSNLDTLFITSSSHGLTDEQRTAEPLAGSLFAVNVGVRGVLEPNYAG